MTREGWMGTTVAHSLTLTYTAPLFIAVLSRTVLQEKLPHGALLGIVLGLVGLGVLTGFEPHLSARMVEGDLLALLAAVSFAL